jgi:D-glycero-alpha-D-manno-heptose-7-phosphate kinase
MLRVSAPLRIDLAGGTLDIYPLYLFLDGGLTVNLAIDRCARAELKVWDNRKIQLVAEDLSLEEAFSSSEEFDPTGGLGLVKRLIKFYKPNQGLELRTAVEAPPGAGLGGSSALALAVSALLNRITGRNHDLTALIGLTRDLEAQALGVPAGVQDYYAAAYGGLNTIWLGPGGERRERLEPSAAFLEELEERLILSYTGIAHCSGRLNWEVFKRCVDGEPKVRKALGRIKEAALWMRKALVAEDLEEVGQALRAEWEARRDLAPGITTPEIDRLIELALRNSAIGAKLCGAGGGGALLLLAREGTEARLAELLQREGGQLLDFRPAPRGLEIEEV